MIYYAIVHKSLYRILRETCTVRSSMPLAYCKYIRDIKSLNPILYIRDYLVSAVFVEGNKFELPDYSDIKFTNITYGPDYADVTVKPTQRVVMLFKAVL